MPRHITMAVTSEVLGGAERHALDLAERLAARGHDVDLMIREGAADVAAAAARTGLATTPVSTYGEVAAAIDRLTPDLVQHFDSMIVVAGLELSTHRAASVQLLHANHALEPQFRTVSTEDADVRVAVSASAARHAPDEGPPPRVVWNAVDGRRFTPRTGPRVPGPLRVLNVARIDEASKGSAAVLAACAALPSGACRLGFVGDGPDADALADGLPAWAGLQRACADIAELYRGADVLVSASPSEGFGLVIAEAAASGLGIVAVRCGGVTDRLVHEQNALLVNDPAELGAALRRLHEDADLRTRLGAAARARMLAEFGIEAMVDGYEAAHEAALARMTGVTA